MMSFEDYTTKLTDAIHSTLAINNEQINEIATFTKDALKKGSTIFLIGNGGSAAQCNHIEAEKYWGYHQNPTKSILCPHIKILSLCSNTAVLSAISNDYGIEFVFSCQLAQQAVEGDVLIALSTSGESENIVNALKYCQKNNIMTIGLLGLGGGAAKAYCSKFICVEGAEDVCMIQDVHMTIAHWLVRTWKSI